MLIVRTFLAMRATDPGFVDARHVQTVRISIPQVLVPEPDRVARTQHDIAQKLAAIPGVVSVGFSSVMHMEGLQTPWDAVRVEGAKTLEDEIPPLRVFKFVSPGFFATTGTRLIAGRDYTWTDLSEHRRFVIVSENLARELWGSADNAIGKRIQGVLPEAPWREVIGVVQDVRDNGVQEPPPAIVYWQAIGEDPHTAGRIQVARAVTFAIRSDRAGVDGFLKEIEEAVWSINASLPVASPRTLQEIYDRSMARTAFALVMMGIAAAVALMLGLVGIYGVIAYAVSQRTREIGIRLALGAQPGELKRMFVRYGFVLAALGIVPGLVAAAGVTRLMSSLLFGVSPLDPMTYAIVPLVLVIAAVLASYLPARRVSGVNPVEALRAE
jgi:predicted permease